MDSYDFGDKNNPNLSPARTHLAVTVGNAIGDDAKGLLYVRLTR